MILIVYHVHLDYCNLLMMKKQIYYLQELKKTEDYIGGIKWSEIEEILKDKISDQTIRWTEHYILNRFDRNPTIKQIEIKEVSNNIFNTSRFSKALVNLDTLEVKRKNKGDIDNSTTGYIY